MKNITNILVGLVIVAIIGVGIKSMISEPFIKSDTNISDLKQGGSSMQSKEAESKMTDAQRKALQDLQNNNAAAGTKASTSPATTTILNNKSNTNINTNNLNKKTMQVTMKTNMGDIELTLNRERTPNTVDNFVKLAQAKFYDGTRFHRVIKDFMIQGGDPLSKDVTKKNFWGTGGPDYKFADEFLADDNMKEGDLAMANSGPGTNGSQFFIVTAAATPWLNGKHTIFGKVSKGMDIVNKIEASRVDGGDKPIEDVIVMSVTIN